jgi:hypothetical protein
MEAMTHIKQAFVDLNLVKAFRKIQVVEVISKGKTTNRIKNSTIETIKELNPLRSEPPIVPNEYDTWVYYRDEN